MANYSTQFSNSGIHGFTEPSKGKGVLYYYQDLNRPRTTLRITFEFSTSLPWLSLPWHKTGLQPFTWDYLPPTAERAYPVIRIVAARHVFISVSSRESLNKDENSSDKWMVLYHVQIFRPQHEGIIYSEGERIEPYRLIRTPFYSEPPKSANNRTGYRDVKVYSKPDGVIIANLYGKHRVDISVKDPKLPAAFWYVIVDPDNPDFSTFEMIIIHTKNVKIDVKANAARLADRHFIVAIDAAEVDFSDVPFQGESLSTQSIERLKGKFKRVKSKDFSGGTKERLFDIFDAVISAIPFIGDLYDIAQFSYSAVTGKDFWGRKISQRELLVIAGSILISVGTSSKGFQKRLSNAASKELKVLFEQKTIIEFEHYIEPNLKDTVSKTDLSKQQQLVTLVEDSLKVGSFSSQMRFFKQLSETLSHQYLELKQRSFIEQIKEGTARIFSGDLKNFNNPILAEQYSNYKSRYKTKAKSPIEWAMITKGNLSTTELRRELGDNYKNILKAAVGQNIVTKIPSEMVKLFDKLMVVGVIDYGTLENMTRKYKGFGKYYERDHLFEQRFWRNNPDVDSAFDELSQGFAFVVPKNPHIASLLPSVKPIRYVHTEKTKLLNMLIPKGREAQFSLQQIWDAHIFTFKSLDADPSIYGERLKDMFLIYKKALEESKGVSINLKFKTAAEVNESIFLPENGWPVFGTAFKKPSVSHRK